MRLAGLFAILLALPANALVLQPSVAGGTTLYHSSARVSGYSSIVMSEGDKDDKKKSKKESLYEAQLKFQERQAAKRAAGELKFVYDKKGFKPGAK